MSISPIGFEVPIIGVNQVSPVFQEISADAQTMAEEVTVSSARMVRQMTSDLVTLGTGATAVASLSVEFGVLSREQARGIMLFGQITTTIGAVTRAMQILQSSEIITTAVTWALNASLATKIMLLSLGTAAVIVAAAAMAGLAMQTRGAASAMREYNEAAREGTEHTRSIVRAGEQDLLRSGIE